MNDAAEGPISVTSKPSDGEGPTWGLLQDLLAAHGRQQTAELLGVSDRTLRRAESAGRLTKPLEAALVRYASTTSDPGPAAGDIAVEVAGLASRVDGLERNVSEAMDEMEESIESLVASNEKLQVRVTVLESAADHPLPAVCDGDRTVTLNRRYPQLITEEAEPGEEAVYRTAMPLVAEWRSQRRAYLDASSSWAKLTADLRVTELEIELISDFELTLPTADLPWTGMRRHSELRRRHRTLERLRRERRRMRARRWLLRLFTFGLMGR